MEKLLPQNIEAEQAALGSIMIDPDAFLLIDGMLTASDFYRNAHQIIYETMASLAVRNVPPDFITVCDELERVGQLEEIDGSGYINSLINCVPTSGNICYYAGIVARTGQLRRLIHAAGRIAALGY